MDPIPQSLARRIAKIVEAAGLAGARAKEAREDLEQHVRDALDDGQTVSDIGERLGDPLTVGPVLGRAEMPPPKRPDPESREPFMQALLADLRFGARALVRSPGVALTAASVLALAIGANTVVFTVVNELLLRPLPVADQAGLVDVWPDVEGGNSFLGFGWNDFLTYQDAEPLESLAAFSGTRVLIGDEAEQAPALATLISAEYVGMLGLQPTVGTMDFPGGNRLGETPVAVLSHAFWTARFGSDPSIVGRTLRIDDQPVTVVGVGPVEFRGHFIGFPTDLWLPAQAAADFIPGFDPADPAAMPFEMIGRLRGGASPGEASRALNRIAATLENTFPDTHQGRRVGVTPTTGVDHSLQQPLFAFLAVLTVVAALVLLIACLNVGGILLVRTLSREREMAVRLALGAGNGRLVRQLSAEALLLSGIACVGGLLLALFLNGQLADLFTALSAGLGLDLSVDGRVMGLTTLAAVAAAGMAVCTPALYLLRKAPASALATRAEPLWGGRVRAALVLGQVAVSVALVIATGLFLRSLAEGVRLDPGFDPDRVAVFSVQTQGEEGLENAEALAALLEDLRSVPGVEGTAAGDAPPIGVARSPMRIQVPGVQPPAGEDAWVVDGRRVVHGWFETVGIPLRQGRGFIAPETLEGGPVAVVSNAFAQRFWPDGEAVGRSLFLAADPGTPVPIVGVADDVQYLAQVIRPDPLVYLSWAGQAPPVTRIVVQGDTPLALSGEIRNVLSRHLPVVGAPSISTPRDVLDNALLPQRLGAVIVGGMGLAGLFLACVGLYGLVQFTVARQRHELAVRRALGGSRRTILAGVLNKGLRVVLVGVVLGLVLASFAARALSGFLMGVSPRDPATYGAVAALFVVVAVLASWLPAHRAASIEPSQVLRGN